LLNKGVLLNKREATKVLERINEEEDYYYEEDIDE